MTNQKLAGKVALITGAARGQGRVDAIKPASDDSRYITGIGLPVDLGMIEKYSGA